MEAMEKIVAMYRAAEAVHFVLEIGRECREPDGAGADFNSQALVIVPRVAEGNAGNADGPPISIHLTIKQVRILELGADVRVGHPARKVQVRATSPVGIVEQPGLSH